MLGNLDADMDATHGHISRVAEKIREALAQPYLLPNPQEAAGNTPVQHSCTASIGIATFPGEQVTADEILKRADIAMYRAKDAGSNAVSFYDVTPAA
jgi:diguanylate cyclase (GGDEF)-like protein